MHYNISLDRPGRNYNTDKTSHETNKQVKPMELEEINQFENLNEVRIKVFGHDGRYFLPIKLYNGSMVDTCYL